MSEDKVIDLVKYKQGQEKSGAVPPPTVPDFITPHDISTMSDDAIDEMLSVIRLKRMTATLQYEQAAKDKDALAQTKAKEQLDRKHGQVFTSLERVIKAMDQLEVRVIEMRALRVQAGLEF